MLFVFGLLFIDIEAGGFAVMIKEPIDLSNAVNFSHMIMRNFVREGMFVVDATMGRGQDTLLLSKLVGINGTVLSFDVQKEAVEITNELFTSENIDSSNTRFILDTHANIGNYMLNEQLVDFAIFNLGYLPGVNKSVTTDVQSVKVALELLIERLKSLAVILVVVYPGHDVGRQEVEFLNGYLVQLKQKQFSISEFKFINQRNNPPYVFLIQKR